MLGTNDSKLCHYKNRLPLAEHVADFIAEFKELNPLVRTFIAVRC